MKNILAIVFGFGVAVLSGCGLLDAVSGIERDETGKVTKVAGGIAETASGILYAMGGGGAVAGGLIAWVIRGYRHKRIVESGGKDDNADGIPDEQQKPPTSPT